MDEEEQALALQHLLDQFENPIPTTDGRESRRRRVRKRVRRRRSGWSEFSVESGSGAESSSEPTSSTLEDFDALAAKSRPLDYCTSETPDLSLIEYAIPKQVDALSWHLAQEAATVVAPTLDPNQPTCVLIYRDPTSARSPPPPLGGGMDTGVFADNTAKWIERETSAFCVSVARRAHAIGSFSEWSHADCVVMHDVLTAMSILGEQGDNSPIVLVDSALPLYAKLRWGAEETSTLDNIRRAQEIVEETWSGSKRVLFPVEATEWGTCPCGVDVTQSTHPESSPLYDRTRAQLSEEDRDTAGRVWGRDASEPRFAETPSEDLLFGAAVSNEPPVDFNAIRRLAKVLPQGEMFILRAYVVQSVDGEPLAVPVQEYVKM